MREPEATAGFSSVRTGEAAWPWQLEDCGDRAFTLRMGSQISVDCSNAVLAWDQRIAAAQAAGGLAGLQECVPGFCALTLFYDPLRTTRAQLIRELSQLTQRSQLSDLSHRSSSSGETCRASFRSWRLPVCYHGAWEAEGDAAPQDDLAAVARACAYSVEDLVAAHCACEFRVYLLGFQPGFAYLGDLPEGLRLPRRASPRRRVPTGSVAIAERFSAIYPWQSPGGWHLLGRCPVPLFDPAWSRPALLQAGDQVGFYPVEFREYQRLRTALADASLSALAFQVAGPAPESLPKSRPESQPNGREESE